MSEAIKIAGTWVADAEMHPATNIANRRFWARGNVEGTFRGLPWPTPDGQKPDGLFWHFPTPTPTQEGE